MKNAQISSLQQGVTLLCLIGNCWKLDGWVGGTLGLGLGGVVLPPGLPNRALQLEALFSAAASPLEAAAKLKMFATSVLSHFPSPHPFFGKGSEKM